MKHKLEKHQITLNVELIDVPQMLIGDHLSFNFVIVTLIQIALKGSFNSKMFLKVQSDLEEKECNLNVCVLFNCS